MNSQQAMKQIEEQSPFVGEFYSWALKEQLEFFISWFMVISSTIKTQELRDTFTDKIIDAVNISARNIPEFIEVKCATCENMVEVHENAKDEVNLCVSCAGRMDGHDNSC